MDTNGIAFSEKFGDSMGTLVINGLTFPRIPDFEPLGKFWSCLRRRFCERTGLSVSGVFVYDDMQELISCMFYLDFCPVEQGKFGEETYIGMFKDNFHAMCSFFEESLLSFVAAEDKGYDDYCKLIKSFAGRNTKTNKAACDRLFNVFLKTARLRTRADEIRSATERRAREAQHRTEKTDD
ncbi:hypothetical protein IKE83_01855 [Candidatus Saccharibacteria bacterium]|nr:hypothetical protein [Candidatus Saccharibacteria bacterium]